MSKKEVNVAFIFRRDLRVIDNNAIELARQEYKGCKFYGFFILDSRQVGNGRKNAPYKSHRAIKFMHEALVDLNNTVPISILYGQPDILIEELASIFDVLAFNRDYTPFSTKRDSAMIAAATKAKKPIIAAHDDCFLTRHDLKPYKKFTPYYKYAKEHKKLPKKHGRISEFYELTTSMKKQLNKLMEIFNVDILTKFYDYNIAVDWHPEKKNTSSSTPSKNNSKNKSDDTNNNQLSEWEQYYNIRGTREEGIRRLKETKNYASERQNFTGRTSRIGAYIKFGLVSPREVYEIASDTKLGEEFLRQLYWRDFYLQLLYNQPQLIGQERKTAEPMYDKGIKWRNNNKLFVAWAAGKTGFPIVDACMRCMIQTGFMPNRGRMLVAIFLTKLMLMDWRKGERYFATQLTDYDPANNNGGWQWSSSTGADSVQYTRIMNPWIQSKKYDKNAEFIKLWVPELRQLDKKVIHKWNEFCGDPKYKSIYIKPILDYVKTKKTAIQEYKKLNNNNIKTYKIN